MTGREHLLVTLVDEAGMAIGACSAAGAHTAPGRRHRAFSVLLYDQAGRVLLQRRAAVTTHPGTCTPWLPGVLNVAASGRKEHDAEVRRG